MKHWLSVSLLSFVLCFLFGAWWGHRLHEQATAPPKIKATLVIAAEEGFFPPSLITKLLEKFQVELVVKAYEHPAELLSLLKSTSPPDLIQFPSYLFKSLQFRGLLGPLDINHIPNIKNISKDLRFGVWDPEENFVLPLNWNGLLFVYNPSKFEPPSESLKELIDNKKLKLSLKQTTENIVWMSQVLGRPDEVPAEEKTAWISKLKELPWSSSSDIEKFKRGEIDLLQISWSELQTLNSDLGTFKLWFPEEKLPFFVDFIALSKDTPKLSKARKLIHQILDTEVYPELISQQTSAAVMDLGAKWEKMSARFFRELPLTQIRPLFNSGYDLIDLNQAKTKLFHDKLVEED